MHPIYAPMCALNVRPCVMISEAVDSRKRGNDNAWSGKTSKCRPCYRQLHHRQTRSCQLSSYRRRHRHPCQSPQRCLSRHTFAHILLYPTTLSLYIHSCTSEAQTATFKSRSPPLLSNVILPARHRRSTSRPLSPFAIDSPHEHLIAHRSVRDRRPSFDRVHS